ncbi:MAG TPA: DALR domain-containing protein, partial [Candidatus Acidoferrum sp.]|nr:DALR domain-containing protein [Candidatus Acidoferrum sp.]
TKALEGFQEFLRAVDRLASPGSSQSSIEAEAEGELHPAEAEFRAAMDDDFNTAKATGVLFDLVREGNRLLQETAQEGTPRPASLAALQRTATLLRRLGGVLGLDLHGSRSVRSSLSSIALMRPAADALTELGQLLQAKQPESADLEGRLTDVVLELLAHREAARKAKAWDEADRIRQTLFAHGFRMEDTRTATHAISEFPREQGRPSIDVTVIKA